MRQARRASSVLTKSVLFPHNFLMKSVKKKKKGFHVEYFSSAGGHSAKTAYVSWLLVPRGFGGRHVFHNDMERSLDMRARGHPALSLLIPDSSFSLDSTGSNHQTGPWVLLDERESQGARTRRHTKPFTVELLFLFLCIF